MNKQELIDFEEEIKQDFLAGKIRYPIHLSKGNEQKLIDLFSEYDIGNECNFLFSTHRSHIHALLKGIPKEWLREQIHRGNSMHIMSPEYKFFAASIVAGCCPIAVGVAMAIKRKGLNEHVWAFVGDMAATTGTFRECVEYARCFELPITFIIEDNGLSTNSPTYKTWNNDEYIKIQYWNYQNVRHYEYVRDCPHINVGTHVEFR